MSLSAQVVYREVRQPFGTAERSSVLRKAAFASLWFFVFAIPWEDAITISNFGTSARLIGAITGTVGILAILESGRLRKPAVGHALMMLFVVSAAATYLWSLYPEGTLTEIITYAQLFTMAWLIWELAPRVREQTQLMQAYVLGTFVSGTDTLHRFLSHQESVYQRYAGARLDANDLGLMMALSIPFSYYLLLQSRGAVAWLYRLQLALAGTTILLTASRGAALASFVALAIVPLTQTRLTSRQRIAVLLSLALLIVGALVFVPATSWERLSTMPHEFRHGTMTGRTLIWSAGWELFRERPFLGIGANAFRLLVSRVLNEPIRPESSASPAPPAHNTFLSVLVEQGIIGLTIFCALLTSLALSAVALPRLSRKLWLVSLCVWAVGVSGLTWEMRKPTWFLFALLLAQAGSLTPAWSVIHLRSRESLAVP